MCFSILTTYNQHPKSTSSVKLNVHMGNERRGMDSILLVTRCGIDKWVCLNEIANDPSEKEQVPYCIQHDYEELQRSPSQ